MVESDVLGELLGNQAFSSILEIYETATDAGLLPSVLAAASSINPAAASLLTAQGIDENTATATATAALSDSTLPVSSVSESRTLSLASDPHGGVLPTYTSSSQSLAFQSSDSSLTSTTSASLISTFSFSDKSSAPTYTGQASLSPEVQSQTPLSSSNTAQSSPSYSDLTDSGEAIETATTVPYLSGGKSAFDEGSTSQLPLESITSVPSTQPAYPSVLQAISATSISSDYPLPDTTITTTEKTSLASPSQSTEDAFTTNTFSSSNSLSTNHSQADYGSGAGSATPSLFEGNGTYPDPQASLSTSLGSEAPLLSNKGPQNNYNVFLLFALLILNLL